MRVVENTWDVPHYNQIWAELTHAYTLDQAPEALSHRTGNDDVTEAADKVSFLQLLDMGAKFLQGCPIKSSM